MKITAGGVAISNPTIDEEIAAKTKKLKKSLARLINSEGEKEKIPPERRRYVDASNVHSDYSFDSKSNSFMFGKLAISGIRVGAARKIAGFHMVHEDDGRAIFKVDDMWYTLANGEKSLEMALGGGSMMFYASEEKGSTPPVKPPKLNFQLADMPKW